MIQIENVTRTYGEGPSAVHAVKEVSTSIETGSFVTIVGSSGSGKSTLLNLIGALDRPTSGRIILDGKTLYNLSDNQRTIFRREKIGFVFQFFNLLPTLSAIENVTLPAKLMGKGKKEILERAEQLLENVGLKDRKHHQPDQLSGGEMQRVAIARALMMDPPVLLADEPTGNLDSNTGKSILQLIRGAVDSRRTVLLVTHDLKIAEQGDRILTMEDGRLLREKPGHDAVKREG